MTEKSKYYAKGIFLLLLILAVVGGAIYFNIKSHVVTGAGCIVNGEPVRTCGQ